MDQKYFFGDSENECAREGEKFSEREREKNRERGRERGRKGEKKKGGEGRDVEV